jgi:hypothetical protein
MGFGISLILIAVGAILTWAVHSTSSAIDVNTVGVILMIVGLVGFLLSLAFWSTWWGPGYFRRSYAAGGPSTGVRRVRTAAPREEVVEEEEVY